MQGFHTDALPGVVGLALADVGVGASVEVLDVGVADDATVADGDGALAEDGVAFGMAVGRSP